MNASIEPHDDVAALQRDVADSFCDLARETIAARGLFRVSLSGGSTPRRIYELLAERDLPWDKIHFFWGDERNVPHDHEDSNYRMVRQALLDKIGIPADNVHPVPVDVAAPDRAASAYEALLRQQFGLPDQGGALDWDLVLLGMGDDAHTASLFPETKALAIEDRLFVENFVPKFDAYRYTMTYPAIESAKQIWFLIAGAAKRDALRQVLSGEGDVAECPSLRVRPTRWFVDKPAFTG